MNQPISPNLQSRIFIYGPPGCGKTTLGCKLAEDLGLPFYDLDGVIESRTGISIPEIFAFQGEDGFRDQERAALEDVLARQAGVVALGGGALLSQTNRALVEATGPVLCLTADFEVLLERSRASSVERPLIQADPHSRLAALMEQRGAHYASFPLQLDTGGTSLDESVLEAQIRLGFFRVSGMGAGYDVRVLGGSLNELGPALAARSLQGPMAVVSDSNVGPIYAEGILRSLEKAGFQASQVTIPAGEAHKNIRTLQNLWTAFLEARIERGSTVVALGGGVVGDLAGFAAATYMRGVRWVAVPTSLLAMVDASLGGKTGADLPQGKNLVGAFHPPALVLADQVTLSTLPEAELHNGMAEVVKHGVLADPALFSLCSQGWGSISKNWDAIVRRAMAVKIRVIQEDPYEKGRRAALNLGHTLGHAVELASDFRLKHGEAVSVGMVFAARLAEQMGIGEAGVAREITATLQGLGLPTEIPPSLDREQVLAAMERDKKRAGGATRFVLPVKIGEVRWGIEVSEQNLGSVVG
jgi:shikimate kinase/3-dehydroquinate synthase